MHLLFILLWYHAFTKPGLQRYGNNINVDLNEKLINDVLIIIVIQDLRQYFGWLWLTSKAIISVASLSEGTFMGSQMHANLRFHHHQNKKKHFTTSWDERKNVVVTNFGKSVDTLCIQLFFMYWVFHTLVMWEKSVTFEDVIFIKVSNFLYSVKWMRKILQGVICIWIACILQFCSKCILEKSWQWNLTIGWDFGLL